MEMNVFMQKITDKNRKACYIEQNGSGGPIILWGMYLIVEMKYHICGIV